MEENLKKNSIELNNVNYYLTIQRRCYFREISRLTYRPFKSAMKCSVVIRFPYYLISAAAKMASKRVRLTHSVVKFDIFYEAIVNSISKKRNPVSFH